MPNSGLFSYEGLIISLLIFLPELVYFIINGLKEKGRTRRLRILELILGILLVASGAVPKIFEEGYLFNDIWLFIIWLVLFAILLVCYYIVWYKYFKSGKNPETLNDKFVVIFPEAVYSILLFGITACFTFNYVMLALTILFTIVKVNRIVDINEILSDKNKGEQDESSDNSRK